MLRFCGKNLVEQNELLKVDIAEEHLVFDKNIWESGRQYYKRNGYHDVTRTQLVPIWNTHGELLCYGWQDNEANRELRMIKELRRNEFWLQFGDIYPKIKEVMVWGCNELAFYFVRYLKKLGFPVLVYGKYWEYLGYKSVSDMDVDDEEKMIVYAESILPSRSDLFQRMLRSVSPNFECIDKIYEANILAGNIEIVGGVKWLLGNLHGRDVIIQGTDEKAQDIYDFLYSYGIEIKCFAASSDGYRKEPKVILGKNVLTISEILHNDMDVIIIGTHGNNSAWGNRYVELYDYYGYERNRNFFLFSDYADIPNSNLIHILRGKSIFLTGDARLCTILAQYLMEVEKEDIRIQYERTLREGMIPEGELVFSVFLWYGQNAADSKTLALGKSLNSIPYSNYFSRITVFAIIDQYRNKDTAKYCLEAIVPKGILLNVTYGYSGNIFFHGILDGHPDILLLRYDMFSNNLFVYCIRLSIEKAENILSVFELMLKEEMSESDFLESFPFWSKFKKSMERWLARQERFTSQELFVLFHIGYAEMMSENQISDMSQKVIYFDPHWIDPEERVIIAQWLESKVLNGQIISIRRDNVVRLCSLLSYVKNTLKYESQILAHVMIYNMISEFMDINVQGEVLRYFDKFEVRFEDLKLHPKEEIVKICERMEIPWMDSMLHTTEQGKPSSMGVIRDFDLKPVFNKHEDEWSEFDRFRICLISGPYQKEYGYSYEDCMKFSRLELEEMFLKEFLFQQKLTFDCTENQLAYCLWAYEAITWKLWNNRQHIVMGDIKPKFDLIEVGRTEKMLKEERELEKRKQIRKNREYFIKLIQQKEKMVIYGLGRDGEALWDCLDQSVKSRLVLCDKKADSKTYLFQQKSVIRPKELCTKYNDYKILVTSSRFYREISVELSRMGIGDDRIICNTIQFWEEQE